MGGFAGNPDFGRQSTAPDNYDELEKKFQALVTANPVVLFMKGSPEAPQCGFSRQVANVLRMNNVDKYTYVDILKNQQVREGMKKFSDWPTFPQLYVTGSSLAAATSSRACTRTGSSRRSWRSTPTPKRSERAFVPLSSWARFRAAVLMGALSDLFSLSAAPLLHRPFRACERLRLTGSCF